MKTLLVLLLTCCCFGTLKAQTKTAEEWANQLTDSLQKTLSLSDDQRAKVYPIELEFVQKAEPIKQNNESKIQKLKALKELDEKRDSQLKEVLSEAQFAKYSEGKKENRKQLKEKYKANRKT
ncbi:hypothetical protein [Fluviicola sp.]|uniref:hypothetical protein n=1 Tax=Fluviicola sp. TaxID=1917219 RepID=UPI003D2CE718